MRYLQNEAKKQKSVKEVTLQFSMIFQIRLNNNTDNFRVMCPLTCIYLIWVSVTSFDATAIYPTQNTSFVCAVETLEKYKLRKKFTLGTIWKIQTWSVVSVLSVEAGVTAQMIDVFEFLPWEFCKIRVSFESQKGTKVLGT
jgi:hypothetical protein